MDKDDPTAGKALAIYGRLREPNHRVRHDGWTGEKQRGFLEALAKVGNVRDACRAVGLTSTSAYRLRKADPAFGAAWDGALRQASTSLEAVAFARAVDGVEETVIRNGQEVARKRRYSDSLLRLLLQASNPEKYGRTGGQAPVAAREAVEARVRAIQEEAYARAWRAFAAEYRYLLEPDYVGVHIRAKLYSMHVRMCENPWCARCHPERQAEPSHHPAGRDHPVADAPPIDPIERWWQEDKAAIEQVIVRARAAGDRPAIEPAAYRPRGYDDIATLRPPPLDLYGPTAPEG